MFLESQRDLTPSAWFLCSGSLTEYAEKDHFLRYLCLQTGLFHLMMDTSNGQHLKGIAFPVLTLMDVPKAKLALPPRLKLWLTHSCTGTVFGVVRWCCYIQGNQAGCK